MAGPGDRFVGMNEMSGYQPVSRVGEIVMNAFVDSTKFHEASKSEKPNKPYFHDWATALPGMIALIKKNDTRKTRSLAACETAAAVTVCSYGFSDPAAGGGASAKHLKMEDYTFAGVVRSKSVRSPAEADGVGPIVDEFFTIAIGGLVTMLNNGDNSIHAGDEVYWDVLEDAKSDRSGAFKAPRFVIKKVGTPASPDVTKRVFGVAKTFAKKNEQLDVLLRQ